MVVEGAGLATDPDRLGRFVPGPDLRPRLLPRWFSTENISTLIEERHAALTSAIYSAPTTIQVGDDIDHLNLLERLHRLSYTQTQSPTSPGEFAMMSGAIWINVRDFRVGVRDYPAALMRLVLHGKKITGIADAYGIAQKRAALEPEVIGTLARGRAVGNASRYGSATFRRTS